MGSVLKEGIQIIPFFSPAQNSQFLVYDPMDKELGNDDSPGRLQNFEKNKGSLRVYEFFFSHGKFRLECDLKFVCDKLKILCNAKYGLHTALSTDLSKNLVLITKNDMHVLDLESAEKIEHFERKGSFMIQKKETLVVEKLKTHIDTRIHGATLLEDRYCYISIEKGASNEMVNRFADNKNMLAIMDLDILNERFDAVPIAGPITSIIGGANSKIHHSISNNRIIFMKSFNRIASVPMLHSVANLFACMPPAEDILVMRNVDGKLVVFTKFGKRYVFSVTTGKLHKNQVVDLTKRHLGPNFREFVDEEAKRDGSNITDLIG